MKRLLYLLLFQSVVFGLVIGRSKMPRTTSKRSMKGGWPVKKGEFPHMAAIGWTTFEGVMYLCGGSLISAKHVLTAAHCAANEIGFPPDTVRLGEVDISLSVMSSFSQQIKIKSFKRHPQHQFSRKYFDIALIELEHDAYFNEAVCPACLWLEKHAPSDPMEAAGYGITGFGEARSPRLLKGKLFEVSKEDCSKQFPKYLRYLRYGLVEEQICAASDHQDTCEGDSGGPLQVDRVDVNKMTIPLIVGVVSFGTHCTDGSTGVYTRVASYKEWIEQETGQSFDYSTCTRSPACSSRKRVRKIRNKSPQYPISRVGLMWDDNDSNYYHCGATLVDYKFALTSAFCVSSRRGYPKFIVAESTGEIVKIEKVYIHPMYTWDKLENDIALLELSKDLKNNRLLVPASLWKNNNENDAFENMQYSVYSRSGEISRGFGLSSNIERNGKCTHQLSLDQNLFCGNNSLKFIPTICKMDYGGPIWRYLENSPTPVLHGIVSPLNKGCGEELVGTRIALNVDWIEQILPSRLPVRRFDKRISLNTRTWTRKPIICRYPARTRTGLKRTND